MHAIHDMHVIHEKGTTMAAEQKITVEHYIETLREEAAAGRWQPNTRWPVTAARTAVMAKFQAAGDGSRQSAYRDEAVRVITCELQGTSDTPTEMTLAERQPLPEELAAHLEQCTAGVAEVLRRLDSALGAFLVRQRAELDRETATRIDAVRHDAEQCIAGLQADLDAALAELDVKDLRAAALQTDLNTARVWATEAGGRLQEALASADSAHMERREAQAELVVKSGALGKAEAALEAANTKVAELQAELKQVKARLAKEGDKHDAV